MRRCARTRGELFVGLLVRGLLPDDAGPLRDSVLVP